MHNALSAGSGLPSLEDKCRKLESRLDRHKRVAVAYSGGVDSSYLAWFVKHALTRGVHALFADSPLAGARERGLARSLADAMGVEFHTVSVNPLLLEGVRNNPPDRCYHCKRAIMEALLDQARRLECGILVEGSHAGDLEHHRPGRRALLELGVGSPLADAGLFKDEIRVLARSAGLSNWDRPSQSCLATRIPSGAAITPDLLKRIEAAENTLWAAGCRQVRVRVHDRLARVEVSPQDFPLLLDEAFRQDLVRKFEKLGFLYVTLDLAGFCSGSMDRDATEFRNNEPSGSLKGPKAQHRSKK